MYINIHSHYPAVKNEWVLQSISNNFERRGLPKYFSGGLHPWYLEKEFISEYNKLQSLVHSPHLLAIGECGLDKVCSTDFHLQVSALERQVLLANEFQKPLIIHCVKAYEEVVNILHKCDNQVPVVFHGFNKSKELALQLTGKGFYLSFGVSLQKSIVSLYLSGLPLSNICFETDDSDVSIESIYALASENLKISLDELISQVQKNVETILSVKL